MLKIICFVIIAVASAVLLIVTVFSTRKMNQDYHDIVEWSKLSRGENSEIRCSNCVHWEPFSEDKGFCKDMNIYISGTNHCSVWVRKNRTK